LCVVRAGEYERGRREIRMKRERRKGENVG
jgi:hypothetical protein